MSQKLFLMLGAPASGKDYWIAQHHLQQFAITPDVFRQQFSTTQYSIDSHNHITTQLSNSTDRDVWQAVHQSVVDHIEQGQFAIVNATHLFKGSFSPYTQICRDYHYQIYVIDTMKQWFDKFDGDLDKINQQLVTFDQTRPATKQVGEIIIEKYVERYAKRLNKSGQLNLPTQIHYVDARDEDTIQRLLDWQTTDMSSFKRIKVIGDIHGDFDALQHVFADHQPGDAYVFVGDYLDRGTKIPETFKFITQTLGGKNLFFLRGNHETGWEKFAVKDQLSGQFAHDSLPKLEAIYGKSKLKKIIKKFSKNWLTYLKFDFNGQTFFVSHAGIEPFMTKLPGNTLDSSLFIEGIGPSHDPYSRNIDQVWADTMPSNVINIHGHRNNFDVFQVDNSYDLTDDNYFRWLVIDSTGIHKHEIAKIDTPNFVQSLESEPHIHQHQLTSGIVANNFDRDAFQNNIWNTYTTKARGLFTRNKEIVGRGFNKFFQIGQNPESTIESLTFPVIVAKKWNGFLGITFFDQTTHHLCIYSKGGGETMSKLAQNVLDQTGWTKKLQSYFSIPENQDTTVLFEIIDPVNDPHIVLHDKVMAKPLSIIDNNESGTNLYQKCLQHPETIQNQQQAFMVQAIKDATYLTTVNSLPELKQIIQQFETNYPTKEGLVLYGQNKMLKYKSKFYLKAKELRSILESHRYTKKHYYYGARPWAQYCEQHHITKFSPELALKLYHLDQQHK